MNWKAETIKKAHNHQELGKARIAHRTGINSMIKRTTDNKVPFIVSSTQVVTVDWLNPYFLFDNKGLKIVKREFQDKEDESDNRERR